MLTNDRDWSDGPRERLRERLREVILGELRMAKRAREEILEFCRSVHIEEQSPECEWNSFIEFASAEIRRVAALLAAEASTWPALTDCDRLDHVETALRKRGIVLWQASPCCDSCTWSELPDRIQVIDERFRGFKDHLRGYAFFIDQNLPEMLAESSLL